MTDLEYSDGLSVISLFVQRGTLAASMAGWQPLSLDGYRVYVSGHSVTWAGRGRGLHHDRGRPAADGGGGRRRAAGRRASQVWSTASVAASTGWLTWLIRSPDGLEWV